MEIVGETRKSFQDVYALSLNRDVFVRHITIVMRLSSSGYYAQGFCLEIRMTGVASMRRSFSGFP